MSGESIRRGKMAEGIIRVEGGICEWKDTSRSLKAGMAVLMGRKWMLGLKILRRRRSSLCGRLERSGLRNTSIRNSIRNCFG